MDNTLVRWLARQAMNRLQMHRLESVVVHALLRCVMSAKLAGRSFDNNGTILTFFCFFWFSSVSLFDNRDSRSDRPSLQAALLQLINWRRGWTVRM